LLKIPINKIIGREPIPADYVDESGRERNFEEGVEIKVPIEVEYNSLNDNFVLYGGNHRVRQVEMNGDKYIKAFVLAEDIINYDYLVSNYELV
jgi:ParB-like chromosome segregation protein Spo0J